MPFVNECIRLSQLCWRHFCLPNHHNHVARLRYWWMMPWPLSCMPCNLQSQLRCRLHLEDSRSLEICFSTFLSLQIGRQYLLEGNNWSMTLCSTQIKSKTILTTRLVKKSLNMTKRYMANSNLNLRDPLTFLGSTLMALWQFHCGLVSERVNVCRTLPYWEPTPL